MLIEEAAFVSEDAKKDVKKSKRAKPGDNDEDGHTTHLDTRKLSATGARDALRSAFGLPEGGTIGV